jgi:hypothetical protein
MPERPASVARTALPSRAKELSVWAAALRYSHGVRLFARKAHGPGLKFL